MSQLKILISEDHPIAQQALAATLKSLGHAQVFIAENTENAIELVSRERKFDLLICTITAPYAPELNLLRQLKKCGHIHALILVNETPADARFAIIQLTQLYGYLVLGELRKPFSKTDVRAAIGNYAPLAEKNPENNTAEAFTAKAVANAVRRNQFIPYYQPKIDLQTMKVVGAEILMRWEHPSLGILGPNNFIDIAKRFCHIDTMTLSILEQAINLVQNYGFEENFKLAINIDASQISSPEFYKKIASLMNDKKFRPQNLILEITETSTFKSPVNCLSNLIYLRLLGCEISIDDFGTGYSSLQRVCDLPCTELKLDMGFTKNLRQNSRTRLAVASMAKLSSEMNLKLVAEGIETEEQLNFLKSVNCHIGQGFYFSPPLSAKNLLKWIKQDPQFLKRNS